MLGAVMRGWCCRGSCITGEHTEVTVGKMVPEALSVYSITVKFPDLEGMSGKKWEVGFVRRGWYAWNGLVGSSRTAN